MTFQIGEEVTYNQVFDGPIYHGVVAGAPSMTDDGGDSEAYEVYPVRPVGAGSTNYWPTGCMTSGHQPLSSWPGNSVWIAEHADA